MKKQVLFIVLMLMPLMASAQTEINGIYYNLNSTDKVASVMCRYEWNSDNILDPEPISSYSGEIIIPQTIDYEGVNYTVAYIETNAFSFCKDLISVVIPNSVNKIGGFLDEDFYAQEEFGVFEGCSNLKFVIIPKSVTYIESKAFHGCSGLTSITVENGNTVYDSRNYCNAIVKTSTNELFVGCKSTIIPNSVTSIGSYAFAGCSDLTSMSIPNNVTSIGSYAFAGCSGLTSMTIPKSVTFIGAKAFYGCLSLSSITVENGNTVYDSRNYCNAIVKTSTNELFVGCKSTIIPDSVTSIGNYAFAGCSSLISMSIPNSVTSIGGSAFSGCSGLTSVTIPNSVTSIGGSAFSGCSGLTSVTIPNSVTTLGGQAFSGCSGLTSLFIGDGITSIGSNEFNNLSNLKSLTIGNGVTIIGSSAFQSWSSLSSVSIGKGIKSLGAKAFANCPEIKEVYCYAKDVPTISSNTFENSYYIKFATLYVPESSVDLYKASAWSQFGNIVGITGGNEGERCEKPVITLLANGKIKVESATEGATCVTNITASNAEPLTDGEISLNTPLIVYTVTSYATKEGYDDSEVATATFRYEKAEGDMNGDGTMNIADVIHLVNMILSK